MGGETLPAFIFHLDEQGLSPRGRGNPPLTGGRLLSYGSIPAWAGKPDPYGKDSYKTAVYPRVGGETRLVSLSQALVRGLSPRGRGNPESNSCPASCVGSIPAWAGKPP